MADPRVGMRYQDAVKTATRHAKEGSMHIVQSMANQVAAHEGMKAAKEFVRETTSKGIEKRGRMYFS
jgi:hypothetical protein